jgi:type II secretory pathway pseudopilin PulG
MEVGEQRGKPLQSSQAGFTLLALLAVMALLTIAVAVAGPTWVDRTRREREKELIRIGTVYANAIAQYRDQSPGGSRDYPPNLQALLVDQRYVGVVRHLRQLYPDPLDPRSPWGFVLDASGHVTGVFSQSMQTPLAQTSAKAVNESPQEAASYADWKFIAPPSTP